MAEIDHYLDQNCHGKSIREFTIDTVENDPAEEDLYKGRAWFNTTENRLKFYNGDTVETVNLAGSVSALAFEISDWTTSAQTYDLLFEASEHGRGTANLLIEVVEIEDGEAVNVTGDVEIIRELDTGNVMLRVNRNTVGFENRFAGRLVIL